MVGITINTNETPRDRLDQPARSATGPLNVLVMGDFSGRESRDQHEVQSLGKRKILRIDKDSFDDVFRQLHVQLRVPGVEQLLAFSELDELHPDYLFHNINLFERYRQILRQLNSVNHYQTGVAALVAEGIIEPNTGQVQQTTDEAGAAGGLLDKLIANTASTGPDVFDVNTLIRQTVAPYIKGKVDPKATHYISALERALSEVMGKLMHARYFQGLEARWRALDLLNRRLDTDREVHLHVIDITRRELLDDYRHSGAEVRGSAFARRLHEQVSIRGASPIDCLVLDGALEGSVDDIDLAAYLGELAQTLGASLLLGAQPSFIGAPDFCQLSSQPLEAACLVPDQWQSLREQDYARAVFITAPGFLLRQPYGKHSKAIESFNYEEFPQYSPPDYLWGNGAYLLVMGLQQARQRARHRGKSDGTWACFEQMPLHVYQGEVGESCVVPSTGSLLSAAQVSALEKAGLTVLQSVANSDQVVVDRWIPLNSA